MNTDQITYLVFGIILITALIFDLGLLSKKGQKVTIRQALYTRLFFGLDLPLPFAFLCG
jgi:tellurite resistance protein TerC